MTLSILVASSGRPTLARTLQSIAPQLLPGDECLIDVNDDAPWGHAARNRMMPRARGDALLFTDDDDTMAEDALHAVRAAVASAPTRVHIFKMRYTSGREIWTSEEVAGGNVSTQMFIVPNNPERLGLWGDRYEGDFDFLTSTLERHPHPPLWHRAVIALYRPE